LLPKYVRPRVALGVLGALLLGGCTEDTRLGRHDDLGIWEDALAEQWEDPWRAVPEATLLATSLALIPADDEIQQDFSEENPSKSADVPGNVLQYCAVAVPLVWGGLAWSHGDKGEEFETAAESLAATGLVTVLLKNLTNRERPDGNGTNSFPSGHTAAAFCGATLLRDQPHPGRPALGDGRGGGRLPGDVFREPLLRRALRRRETRA